MNKAVIEALRQTSKRVADCFAASTFASTTTTTTTTTVYSQIPQLVAVSKTKPVHLLEACYSNGQRHFGENYVQEIIEKVPQMPVDTKWHFIGPIQSNKVNNLYVMMSLLLFSSSLLLLLFWVFLAVYGPTRCTCFTDILLFAV